MKIVVFAVICLVALNAFAYRESYRVIGFDENGVQLQGVIYTNQQPLEVEGELIDTNGNTHDYYGRWNSIGHITGQTDEGETIDLTTY